MTTANADVRSIVENLIEVCKDGQEGFRVAGESIDGTELKTLLAAFSLQRAQFAGALQAAAVQLGEHDPKNSGSLGGAIHRGWIDIKEAITGKDAYRILAECERGEDIAVKAYKEALEQGLPQDLEDLVGNQAIEVKATHDKVKGLRDSAKALKEA